VTYDDDLVRRVIGGDQTAAVSITARADETDDAVAIVMAALLERKTGRLDRAFAVAATSRDRQVVEIARAHLDGKVDLADALARDHLADHPDSLIVAWIAGDTDVRTRSDGC
jgi:hypothetical protein